MLSLGGKVIIFTGDALLRQRRNSTYVQAMCQQRLTILTTKSPQIGFSVGYAMQHNRFIYAQLHASLVVQIGMETGDTWQGARLRHVPD